MRLSTVTQVLSVIVLYVIIINNAVACNPRDFMIQDITSIQQNAETELAFVLTATQQEFNNAKKSGALSGAYGLISGSGSYQEAQEKARKIAQATKFDYKSSYASNYFSQNLSSKALSGYIACLTSGSPGLSLWLDSREGDYFTLGAYWIGANTATPIASYDKPPVIDGAKIISKPDAWEKAKKEQIVLKRDGNNDFYLNLKVGGENQTLVIVKDPPEVMWDKKIVTSNLVQTASHGPNPGCSAGSVKTCINPLHPGGQLLPETAAMNESSSSDPNHYSEDFYVKTPDQICVKMIQSTGGCETTQTAQGRLSALESFPRAADQQ